MKDRPTQIERGSMEIIGAELAAQGITLKPEEAPVVLRCIHASADFDYADSLVFSPNAIPTFAALVREGAVIVTDTNMALAGINKTELAKYGGDVRCWMADPDVAREAKERGVTRAAASMERAEKLERPVIFAIGNAPTALVKLREAYDSGRRRPRFIVGVPVGFVNVEAAKEAIMETTIPYIVNRGRKGGSAVAAAICNAILYEMRKGTL